MHPVQADGRRAQHGPHERLDRRHVRDDDDALLGVRLHQPVAGAGDPAGERGDRLTAGRCDVRRRDPRRQCTGVAGGDLGHREALPLAEVEFGDVLVLGHVEPERRRDPVSGLPGAAQRRRDDRGDRAERRRPRGEGSGLRRPGRVERQLVASGQAVLRRVRGRAVPDEDQARRRAGRRRPGRHARRVRPDGRSPARSIARLASRSARTLRSRGIHSKVTDVEARRAGRSPRRPAGATARA